MTPASRLALLLSLCMSPTGFAQGIDNLGTEFLLGYMPNDAGLEDPTPELHLSAPEATEVRVRWPFDAPIVDTTVALTPGEIAIVTFPASASLDWLADGIASNSVHAESDDEFFAYLINRAPFTSDCALALPIDALNTDYLTMDFQSVVRGSQFLIIAPFDATSVTITPTSELIGHAAGVPFDVTLDRGQGYYGESGSLFGNGLELVGTKISADRPIYVANGSYCANIPVGTGFCDHLFETAHPVQSWGKDVLVSNLPLRPDGSIYRVLASEDSTEVQFDGAVLGMIDAGEFIEVGPIDGNHQFIADNPIFVAQFMTGSDSPGTGGLGDPAMGNLVPCEQFQTSYTFATVGGEQFVDNFVTVYAATADIGSVLLDGVPIDATEFTSIADSNFSAAVIALEDGTHTASAPTPLGITVEGLNDFDSYIYPGGALFEFINPQGDLNPPMCDVVIDSLGVAATGTATDDRPSEDVNGNGVLDDGEDLNGNGVIDEDQGIFIVQLSEDSENLILEVDPFTPGDGNATFSVMLDPSGLIGTGSVLVTDGAGNVTACPVDVGCTGVVDYFGAGVAGTDGVVPQLTTGCNRIGMPQSVLVESGLALAHGCLWLGFEPIDIPVAGGTLLTLGNYIYPHDSDANGEYLFEYVIDNDPGLIGLPIYWQAAYVDPMATEGISFSNGMEVVIGE